MQNLFFNFIELFQESAPWLLLGLLIAGMMKWLVPMDLLKKHMGESNLISIIKAALIGAPLPLCSCGVIPAAVGLRRAGASKPATVSFLVATPETGVDSIAVSYALLGPFIAIIRPISAILTAIYVGLLTAVFANKVEVTHANAIKPASGCCSKDQPEVVAVKKACCAKAPTSTTAISNTAVNSIKQKTINITSFASGKLLSDITLWLLLGLLLAAAIKTWLPTSFLTEWGDGLLAMLIMAVIGIPMYICATASTPVAAGFLALGLSPGAVLVFMLAGPATNISTMGMIRKEMGSGVLTCYLFGILTASISLGYFTNWAVSTFSLQVYQVASTEHAMGSTYYHSVSAIILACLMLRNGYHKFIGK